MTKEVVPFKVPVTAVNLQEEADKYYGGDTTVFEFPRAKIASGGAGFFEVPDKFDEPEMVKSIEGIVIHRHPAYAYWPPNSSNDEAPTCFSTDGLSGYNIEEGTTQLCVSCPNFQFGSAIDENGNKRKGKACKTGMKLYILRDGEMWPLQLNIPPTSDRIVKKKFSKLFEMRAAPSYSLVLIFTLEQKKTDKGEPYSVINIETKKDKDGKVITFTGEQLEQLRQYSENIAALSTRKKEDYDDHETVTYKPDTSDPVIEADKVEVTYMDIDD